MLDAFRYFLILPSPYCTRKHHIWATSFTSSDESLYVQSSRTGCGVALGRSLVLPFQIVGPVRVGFASARLGLLRHKLFGDGHLVECPSRRVFHTNRHFHPAQIHWKRS